MCRRCSYDEVPMDVCMYKVNDVVQYVWSWYSDGWMYDKLSVCMIVVDASMDVCMCKWMYVQIMMFR